MGTAKESWRSKGSVKSVSDGPLAIRLQKSRKSIRDILQGLRERRGSIFFGSNHHTRPNRVHHYTPKWKWTSNRSSRRRWFIPVKAKIWLTAGKVLETVFSTIETFFTSIFEWKTINATYSSELLNEFRCGYRSKRPNKFMTSYSTMRDPPYITAVTVRKRKKCIELHLVILPTALQFSLV